ncbi:iron ABC transporter permease [Gordonia sp. (in: high G+C Gram-positive bacteria)]|uniref:ABC transporter permease n=1 Tax=Gordonia sp. (in: high G+C Gram-positive bacteria) TaxID=84139 RepID=UPI002610C926|nr:ABC transporter permease subunit [Gordonia sp. (in: high G+C Gram-positive bacteria)]
MARHRPALGRVAAARAASAGGTLIPLIFVGALFVAPLAALVVRAVHDADAVSPIEAWRRTDAWMLLGVTIGQAAASAVAAIVIAAPVVWLVSTVDFPGALLLRVIVTLPFVLPTVVVGVAFRALGTGLLDGLGVDSGLRAILLAHVFLNVAVVVRVVTPVWQQIDPAAIAAARSLGASGPRAWRDVVLPRLAPAVAAAAALVFLFCSTSFGVIVILGDGRVRTLETEIYQQGIGYFRIPEAVALSFLQILLVVTALILARFLGRRTPAVSDRGGRRRRPHGLGWLPVLAVVGWAVVWLVVPIGSLVVRSLRPGGVWSLGGYRVLAGQETGESLTDSVRYSVTSALGATVIAVAVGLIAAAAITRRRDVVAKAGAALSILPLGVSAVTLGFGYVVLTTYLPREVGMSPLLIPAVQALIAIPVVIGILVPALAEVPQRRRDAAAVLGAGPVRVFCTVDLPMIARSLCAAAGFAFVMAIGEFGATTFLARADTTTLPVMIGSLMGRPGADNLAAAMAASVLLVAVSAVVIFFVELAAPAAGRGQARR